MGNSDFKEDWIKQGYSLTDKTSGAWDFSDEFLWARLKDWLSDSKNTEKPFALIFDSIDTHQLDGWVPKDKRKYYDNRDAIKYASQLTYQFISWAKAQKWYPNTLIVIAGDHPWQDPPLSKFTKLTTQDQHKEIYNLMLNVPNVQPGTVITPAGGFTAMDYCPTVFSAMGISFTSTLPNGSLSHDRIGLGTNLLSSTPTIISQEGIQPYFDELFNKPSSLYQKLLW